MKRAVYHAFEDDLVEGFQRVALNQIVTAGSHEREEGRQAWLDRRRPEFRRAGAGPLSSRSPL